MNPRLLPRVLVVSLLITGGLLTALTGFVLYFAPSGPQSGQTLLLGFTKDFWKNLHIYTAFSLIGIVAAHITLNRRTLIYYLKQTIKTNLFPRRP
jgi:mannose/fructose/N-acetylgalactosamine-specific phosphotransferase system component IIC